MNKDEDVGRDGKKNALMHRDDLIQAHLALINMQRLLIDQALSIKKNATTDPTVEIKLGMVEENLSNADNTSNYNLSDSLNSDLRDDSPLGNCSTDKPESGNQVNNINRKNFTILLPIVLGVLVVALLIKSPKELNELRSQLSSLKIRFQEDIIKVSNELKETQNSLTLAQGALKNTEEALREAQKNQINKEPKNTLLVKHTPSDQNIELQDKLTKLEKKDAVTENILSKEEKIKVAQNELKAISDAIVANKKELINNENEFLRTAITLAKSNKIIHDSEFEALQLADKSRENKLSVENKTWADYIESGDRLKYPDLIARIENGIVSGEVYIDNEEKIIDTEDVEEQENDLNKILVSIKNKSLELSDLINRINILQLDIVSKQNKINSISDKLKLRVNSAPVNQN